MLAIGRALMGRPAMLLLDEPSLGLAPVITMRLFETLIELNRSTGMAMLVVEQNAQRALTLATRAYVLERGRIVREGPSAELQNEPAIQAAYLGGA
jgi:branched-chain amino acid transport system ATP-binding protein